jgi:EAL domain-containing protein (putative c-di-GMP-specific phosphodiesterase class I)/CRP-like cAMP-binding protein
MTSSFLRISVPKGATVFSEGDIADCAYIVERGRIAVAVERDGKQIVIAERSEGDLFGEMAIIDQKPRSASIIALEDCELIRLTRNQIDHRIELADPVLRAIMDVILTRFRELLSHEETKGHIPTLPIGGSNAPRKFAELESNVEAIAQLRLEHELELAIENNQFELHFQPIVDLRSGRIAGFEALVRWRHPTRGLVPPLAFIPAAEASGLIIPLSEWCIRQACESLITFRSAVPETQNLFVSVNISGHDLERPDFFEMLKRTITGAGADPAGLKLEVTEGVLMKDADLVIATLGKCRALGCTVALDDFGTGFSSMSYLSKFPIDTLKIDRSFVQALHTDHASHNIVNAIVALGWGLEIPTVAEGIESVEDADALLAFGQGYYYAKPVPERKAVDLLLKSMQTRRMAQRIG